MAWTEQDEQEYQKLRQQVDGLKKLVSKPPTLDTGLRTMTGAINPNPPQILPKGAAEVPYTTGQQAGAEVAQRIAEEGGKAGFPKLGAAAGTAAYALPRTAQIATEAAIGAKGIKSVGAGAKQALFKRSLPKIGVQIEAVEKAAGARLPGLRQPLVQVARTPDKARVEIDAIAKTLNKKQSPKQLLESHDKLKLILKKFTKNQNAKDNLGSDAVAKASRVQKAVSEKLNKAIKARAPLSKEYSETFARKELLKKIGLVGGLGGAATLAIGGGHKLLTVLAKMLASRG